MCRGHLLGFVVILGFQPIFLSYLVHKSKKKVHFVHIFIHYCVIFYYTSLLSYYICQIHSFRPLLCPSSLALLDTGVLVSVMYSNIFIIIIERVLPSIQNIQSLQPYQLLMNIFYTNKTTTSLLSANQTKHDIAMDKLLFWKHYKQLSLIHPGLAYDILPSNIVFYQSNFSYNPNV